MLPDVTQKLWSTVAQCHSSCELNHSSRSQHVPNVSGPDPRKLSLPRAECYRLRLAREQIVQQRSPFASGHSWVHPFTREALAHEASLHFHYSSTHLGFSRRLRGRLCGAMTSRVPGSVDNQVSQGPSPQGWNVARSLLCGTSTAPLGCKRRTLAQIRKKARRRIATYHVPCGAAVPQCCNSVGEACLAL